MSDQQRRAPAMPAGATSLSERIAALQRKASDSQRRPSSPHLVRTPSAGNSSSSSAASLWASGSSRSGQPPQAVKDRIARFQQSATDVGERPLVPRSSFGAPAPNPDNVGRVLRPYPGAMATGGGSGNWGEGVLRPQMTGSAWLGTGSSGREHRSPGLMPQMTGPTWGRRQASTPESLMIPTTQRHISGRDAFQDLDADRLPSPQSPRPLASHASDVAAQAAAMKGLTLAPPARRQSSASSYSARSSSPANAPPLPSLPDAPTDDVGVNGAAASLSVRTDGDAEGIVEEVDTGTFPSPPRTLPKSPRRSEHSFTRPDTSIEVGVSGASPAKLEQLKASAENSIGSSSFDSGRDKGGIGPSGVAELGQVPSPPPPEMTLHGDADASVSLEGGPSNALSNGSPSSHNRAESDLVDTHRAHSPIVERTSNGSEDGVNAATLAATEPSASPLKTPPPKKVAASNGRKNNSIRRPPPGRIMSVAELDASDDEYEPGWASVISTSRS
ncbi:unnamed protein product [Parajaminaea phylloscopi]